MGATLKRKKNNKINIKTDSSGATRVPNEDPELEQEGRDCGTGDGAPLTFRVTQESHADPVMLIFWSRTLSYKRGN